MSKKYKLAELGRTRLLTAIELVSEGIMIADANWIVRYANPAFERITGYYRDELIGGHTRALKSDVHDKAFYRKIRETLERGEAW